MRPVERGDIPLNRRTGQPLIFRAYGAAQPHLIARMGRYCSYCEVFVRSGIEVEHIKPKDDYPELKTEWTNFLLACKNCNTTKGETDVEIDDLLWPHLHNTFAIFIYENDNTITIHPALEPNQIPKAIALQNLIKLNRNEVEHHGKMIIDARWEGRLTAWKLAHFVKDLVTQRPEAPAYDHAITIVQNNGYWSIWMTVFHDDPVMLERLLEALPGTARNRLGR